MMLLLKYLIAQSGVIFYIITVHRVLYYHGLINFEFKRVDRIKKLWTISFIFHMISLLSFLIVTQKL